MFKLYFLLVSDRVVLLDALEPPLKSFFYDDPTGGLGLGRMSEWTYNARND